MATSKQTYIHTTSANAVMLVWGVPITLIFTTAHSCCLLALLHVLHIRTNNTDGKKLVFSGIPWYYGNNNSIVQ